MGAGADRAPPPRLILSDFFADLSSSARALRQEPAFVLMAVVALSIGVGSTATVFSMANQVLFRPLPGVPDPARVATVNLTPAPGSDSRYSPQLRQGDFDALRASATLLDGLASWGFDIRNVSVDGGSPVQVFVHDVYGDYFDVLGVRPAEGRLLRPEESLGEPNVAVIGQRLRDQIFGEADDVVGRTLDVDGHGFTVVGVAGGGFAGFDRHVDVQLWMPWSALTLFNGFARDDLGSRPVHGSLLARLADGATTEGAAAQLQSLLRGIAAAHSEDAAYLAQSLVEVRPGLAPYPETVGRISKSLGLFGGIVGLVLLIACANVATLLLVRAVRRRGAIATRRALGASVGRIARYHLAESAVLATSAAVVGLAAAWLMAIPFKGQPLIGVTTSLSGFIVDARVLGFAAAAAVATLVLSGVGPAIVAGRFELASMLRAAGTVDTDRLASVRRLMATAQIATCITLLTGAALLGRTVHNLYAIDTGLSLEGLSTLPLGRPDAVTDPASLATLRRGVVAAVDRVPGVEGVAVDMAGPFSESGTRIGLPDGNRAMRAVIRPVSPEWFGVVEAHMLRGRSFDEGEWQPNAGTVPAVVTATLARRLYGGTDVVGQALLVNNGTMAEATVIGVSEDMHMPDAPDRPLEAVFVPLESFPVKSVTLLTRTRALDAGVVAGIGDAVGSVLGRAVTPALAPVTDLYQQVFSEQRALGRLLGMLSVLAVLLASIGLYSVVAFTVAQRRRELGVRIALGADARRIAGLVLGDTAAIVAVGTGAGVVGAYVLSVLLRSRLFGVSQVDPVSYAAAALLFACVAALACWMPARNAIRSDPVDTLREA